MVSRDAASELCRLFHEEVYARVDKIVDFNHQLRNKDEAHRHALAHSFCNYTFEYFRVVMIVYLSAAVNAASVPYVTAVHRVSGKKLLRYDYRIVLPDDRYKHRSAEMARNWDDLVCAAEPLRRQNVSCIDVKTLIKCQK